MDDANPLLPGPERLVVGPAMILWISTTLIVVAGIYLLPTFLAVARGSERLRPAVLIDVLLGWTVVGWIVAMILALIPPRTASPQRGAEHVESTPPPR